MKATELVFKKMEDKNTPELICNVCNAKGGVGFLIADVPLHVDATFGVVVCGEACEKRLKSHPRSNEWLKEEASRMRRLHMKQALKKMGRK